MSLYLIKKNNVITINRGDTVRIPIELTIGKFSDKKEVEIGDKDIIFFGLMESRQHFECALFKQEYTINDFDSEGRLILSLDPLDTMQLTSGVYYYELKLLKHSDDSITTLIPKTLFNIVD